MYIRTNEVRAEDICLSLPDCWPLFDYLFDVFSRLREEVTNECPLQNVKGANRPGGESSRIQTHLGVGESTMGRIVIGAIRPWGERYSGRNVLLSKRTVGLSPIYAPCRSAKILNAQLHKSYLTKVITIYVLDTSSSRVEFQAR